MSHLRAIAPIVIALLMVAGCKGDPADPRLNDIASAPNARTGNTPDLGGAAVDLPHFPEAAFRFEVVVRDARGRPLNGIEVAAWNNLPGKIPGTNSTAPSGTGFPATTIRFSVAEQATVTLSVYDMNNEPIGTLIDDTLVAGLYSVVWGFTGLPAGVYQICMTATNDAGTTLFSDCVLASLFGPDPDDPMNFLGMTSRGGRVSTREAIRFPAVLDLPPLQQKNEICAEGPLFDYLDTVTIVLTDRASQTRAMFNAPLKRGINRYVFTLDGNATMTIDNSRVRGAPMARHGLQYERIESGTPEFSLDVPCPNPFN